MPFVAILFVCYESQDLIPRSSHSLSWPPFWINFHSPWTNQSRDFCCVPGSSLLPPPYWKARRPWGRGWGRRRFASLLYPSNGPLRFVTSHSRFALASMRNHAKNEAPAWGGGWKWAILFCFFHSHLQCSFVFKTPLGKYGSRKSCVLCFKNEINRLLAFLSYHFAVALVYIAVKWYVWQHTLRDLWTF